MTNTIYFQPVNRDYWSASTSPNETPRPSFVDEGACANLETPSSSFSSVIISGVNTDSVSDDSWGRFPPTPWSDGGKLEPSNLKVFQFNELKAATKDFLPSNLLGEGCFGPVFKGWIDENKATATESGKGVAVAVKTLSKESFEGHEEWLAEVNYLGQLYHPNLVKLIGHCLDNEKHLLVYEFMPLGSLENHLFRRGSCQLSWSLRMKVALGAAKGLAFLHRDEINIIHRDVKCSNILLDSNYNAKLSDFGLAKDGPTGDMSHVSTRVMGTFGYAAPEYVATGHLSSKSDVYSFGATLLEIISGQRIMDKKRPSRERNLADWARSYLTKKHQYIRVIDRQLEGQYSPKIAQKVANLVFQCLNTKAKLRPNMDEVVTTLEQVQDNIDTRKHPSYN